ncbi:winged helix-turn-helix transcriptional regulator [Ferrovibrio terrae]|uniref:Winged helix-turn-helix transcriptional regulator n=1 Tax=Ferrovibrio terrae TaxID=2594003 RepID=A0A516H445_9PROT|nr:metalloregulator ArsR/SmtB family transcription factor [Ferrovibrio terrae]QDO98546.1 winged helix-turn-helix transcriptional regulator [Ferrovibrio terrae]
MTNKITSATKPESHATALEDGCCTTGLPPAALAESLRPADEELAMLAKALGHPVRILILRNLLRIGACYFGKLADLLPVAPSTASQHLTILKDAGLVKGEIEGDRPCYCIDLEKLRRMQHLIGDL